MATQPVEGYDLSLAVLPRHLEEHGTNKGHLSVDGGATEGVLGFQGQLYMLDHVGKELEVVQMAECVHGVIECGEGYEDVHKVGEGGGRKVIGVHLQLVECRMKTSLNSEIKIIMLIC